MISQIVVTVFCNGGFHEPLTLRFAAERVLKSEIVAKMRAAGWRLAKDGDTYCSQHKAKR